MEHFIAGFIFGVIAITVWDISVTGNSALNEIYKRLKDKFRG